MFNKMAYESLAMNFYYENDCIGYFMLYRSIKELVRYGVLSADCLEYIDCVDEKILGL